MVCVMRRALAWMVLGGLLSVGCKKPPADHPVDAYLAFARVADKKPKAGYDALSKKTRELLEARAKMLADASGGSIANDPAEIFFSRPGKAPPVGDVKVLEQTAEAAKLSVTADGKTQEVKMVREDSRWRVDLSDAVGATEAAAK